MTLTTDLQTQLPLAGLKVIELHAIGPVPFAGMLLQNLGATVTRISPPADPGLGIAIKPEFDLLNLGKSVIALDLKTDNGRSELLKLLQDTDVLMEGFRPQVLERIGLAPQTLLDHCPRLVIGRLNGWGTQGPLAARAGHDINYLALSGALLAIGTKDQPVPPLNLVADFGGGAMHLVVGILAKLVQRSLQTNQGGGVVSTSILAGTHGLMPMFYGLIANQMQSLHRENNLLDGGMPFYRVYACLDNAFVAVGALEPKFYAQLISLLDLAEQVDLKHQYKASTWPATQALMAKAIAQKTRDQWAALALPLDACLSPVLSFTEAQHHAHNQANGWFGSGHSTSDNLGRSASNEQKLKAQAIAQTVAPNHIIQFS
jgi:alpha-methylacyl-CoA racemase